MVTFELAQLADKFGEVIYTRLLSYLHDLSCSLDTFLR